MHPLPQCCKRNRYVSVHFHCQCLLLHCMMWPLIHPTPGHGIHITILVTGYVLKRHYFIFNEALIAYDDPSCPYKIQFSLIWLSRANYWHQLNLLWTKCICTDTLNGVNNTVMQQFFVKLDNVDTEVCKQVFSWLSRCAHITQNTNQHTFLFYAVPVQSAQHMWDMAVCLHNAEPCSFELSAHCSV